MNEIPMASIIDSLGWTLIHFVWQGALVVATLWSVLRLAEKRSPQVRYLAGCAALLLMVLGAVATFSWQLAAAAPDTSELTPAPQDDSSQSQQARQVSVVQTPASRDVADDNSGRSDSDPPTRAGSTDPTLLLSTRLKALSNRLRPYLPSIVGMWVVGVAFLSIRLFAGWRAIRRTRTTGSDLLEHVWIERLASLRQRLGVAQPVQMLCSASATVPMVLGWLRPAVIVPAGWMTGLSSAQLEAILAHELTHIRRHDYLVNLLQNVVETFFFYHPAVWWISGQIRREREHCCDDVASAACGGALEYSRALTSLEELRRPPLALTVAASGGSLFERVRRLVGANQTDPRASGWPVTAMLLFLGAAVSLLAAGGSSVGGQATLTNESGTTTAATDAEANRRENGISITVLDGTDKKPIPKFRVLAGTRPRSESAEFNKRVPSHVVYWQPHTLRMGENGGCIWPLKKAYDEMTLRIEADGYQPQRSGWIRKSKGRQNIVFLLAKDAGVSGRVLQPDGKPAAGATVVLALSGKRLVIENGKIRDAGKPLSKKEADRWRRETIVQADVDGRFRLPTETDTAAAVLVLHESGVRELTNTNFQKQTEIKLEHWGRIEGRVLWKDKPGADEPVRLSVHREQNDDPGMVASSVETRTDAEGRFAFDKVPPGHAQISRRVSFAKSDGSGTTSTSLPGLYLVVQALSGEPTQVLIGGRGRKVVGQFTGRTTWDDTTFHFHPDAPHVGFPGDNAQWKAFGVFRKSAIGPLFFRDKLKLNVDGSFEIPDMLPGDYQLFLSVPGAKNYAAYRQFKIDPETPGEASPTLNLGEFPLRSPRKKGETTSKPKQAPVRVNIVVAKHVILLERKIVTWKELTDALRRRAAASRVQPAFHFSISVSKEFDMWQNRATKLTSELGLRPLSLSFLSPVATKRYDAIRTADDLQLDPARLQTGSVRLPNGQPAQKATVLVQVAGGPAHTIYLNGGRIRDLVDEVWTSTDQQGEFAVYPADDQFALALLHPEGFAAVSPAQLKDGELIELLPWGKVELKVISEKDLPRSAGLSVTVNPQGSSIAMNFQVFTSGGRILMPPGNIHVQRFLSNSGIAAGSFKLAAGQTHQFELGPPSDADIEKARQIRERASLK